MCFSAAASFTSAALLTVIGALTIKTVKAKTQLMLALVPLFFAIQQASEGLVWLSLQQEAYASLQHLATYLFLFFAYIVWPAWIPLSVWLLEKDKTRKQIIRFLAIGGGLVSGYLASLLIIYPVAPTISNDNIVYAHDMPAYLTWGYLLYTIPVIVPWFVSSIRYFWVFGVSVGAALLASYFFWHHAYGSVWCFFAALLSGMVLFFLNSFKKRS
jgi:hypothetical protein